MEHSAYDLVTGHILWLLIIAAVCFVILVWGRPAQQLILSGMNWLQ